MNREDIIRMAQETGVTAERVRDLERFAKLVAQHEREACAKDEPVAWGVFEGNLHDMFFSQEEAQEMADLKGTHAEARPLYATPQRTWVGLTDDEIEDFVSALWPVGVGAGKLLRAIEAKLKEKNT
jgi:hypothetical protein